MNTEPVVGIDEVGRGALAGPLAVAACVVHNKKVFKRLPLKDSKQLSDKRREFVFNVIKDEARKGSVSYALSYITASTIDKVGVSRALKIAVTRSLAKIGADRDGRIVLDGSLYAPKRYKRARTETKADERFLEVALASIIAKVSRDQKMTHLAQRFPHYGFESHVGYGTKKHRLAIHEHGMSSEHRTTFCANVTNF